MLLIIQLALGLTFIVLLILALCDAITGTLTILSGLVLIVVGYTLKGVAYVIRKINPPSLRRWSPEGWRPGKSSHPQRAPRKDWKTLEIECKRRSTGY